MRRSVSTYSRFILGILVVAGFSVGIASADDNSWLTPPSLGQSLDFFDSGVPYLSPSPHGIYYSDSDSWLTPDSQEQILAWGAENAKENAATLIQPRTTPAVPVTTLAPYTLSRADLDRLLGNYKSGANAPAPSSTPAMPVPTNTIAPPSSPAGDDLHTLDGTSVSLLINRAMDTYRNNPTIPVTIPVTPVATPLPTQISPGGNTAQGTGVSLTGFSLQGRFVRISNTGSAPVVMTGWKITNRQGNSLTFIDYPLGDGSTFTYVLNPSATLTVYFGKDGAMTDTELYYPGGGNFWNAQGDTASLYDSRGQLVGSITA
jgi:hypothetical protein